jgi:hypothetical protein
MKVRTCQRMMKWFVKDDEISRPSNNDEMVCQRIMKWSPKNDEIISKE